MRLHISEKEKHFYYCWHNMKIRCTWKKQKDFARYGGRGIKYLQDWKYYDNFKKDMFYSYKIGLTLERINNNGDYFKENCRWATRKEQANNTKNIEKARRIKYHGQNLTVYQWAQILGVERYIVSQRIFRLGWTMDRCFKEQKYD